MSDPVIMINHYRIDPSHTDEFLARFDELVKVVEAGEPRMLYFAEHLTPDRTEGSTVQIHANAQNMEYHLELVGDRIAELVGYLDFTGIYIYGTPTEAVLEQLRAIAGDGVVVKPSAVGFDRFPRV
jgi:hypothetical protein